MKKIRIRLSIVFVILSAWIISYPSIASIKNSGTINSSEQEVILVGINAYRLEHGLGKLTMNTFLSEEARIHSLEMANNKIPFGHDGFERRMNEIFKQFNQAQAMAENVAMTNEDAKTVIELWLNSTGHRKNIEGDYNLTGIGIAQDRNGRIYVTQIFLRSVG